MTSKYPAHPVQCPYGNHPIFVRPNGSIVAHYADNEMRQRCKGSEETYCDCHLHAQQVCDLCQRVNHTEAFYAAKDAELADPRRCIWFVESRHNGGFEGWWAGPPKGEGGWLTTDPLKAKGYTELEARAVAEAMSYFPTPFRWSLWVATEHLFPPTTVEVLGPGDPRRYTKDRAEAIVYNLSLPGTYVSCGDHYYACVRGDEECPACAREKVLTCEIDALRDAVSPGKCNVGPDYYIRVAQRMRAREMRIIPLEAQPLVGDKIE